MKIHHRFIPAAAALLGLAAVLLSGCVAGAAARPVPGAVAFIRGNLEASVDAGFERSVKAATAAIGQLRFVAVSETQDALSATLVARNADDKRIEIHVESAGAKRARVTIRIGVIGDEALSLTVLDQIRSNL